MILPSVILIVMNYYQRVDRALAHLYKYGEGNGYYQSLLRYFRTYGALTIRQVESVERNMAHDARIHNERAVRAIREWNRNN